jgi:hypothetical protein
MKIKHLPVLALALAGTAYGWGMRGHAVVNRLALQSLPEDGPIFLRVHEEWIAARARVPDTWRQPSEPFLKIIEDPNHGWFKEQFAFLKQIPRSRYEFVLALYDEYLRIKDKDPARARFTNVRWTGTLPYAAMENYERLKSGMRIYRAQQSAGQQTRYTELDLAFYTGWLGHYIADGAQPMHDSIHHDGWRGPNPNGYTRDGSIHARFESSFVDLMGVEAEDLLPMVEPPKLLPDPFDAILQHLDHSAAHVEEIYRLDKQGAFAGKSNEAAKELVNRQLAAAGQLLRDLLYTAWIESSRPAPARTPPDPSSPSSPRYNPATGSAPAPKP